LRIIVTKKELTMPRRQQQGQFYATRRNEPPMMLRTRPRTRRRIRPAWIWIPVVILGSCWLLSGLRPTMSWTDWEHRWGVKDTSHFTTLAALGIVLVGITLLVRFWRRK
jgi:hypothetical protein